MSAAAEAVQDERGLEDRCKWCDAPIFWLTYPKTGKLAPITQELNERGNVAVDLEARTYRFAAKDETGIERRLNHWGDCPHAEKHRAEKKSKGA